ncbi:hypothetical protein F5X99DRAFT_399004 [Biscogniauxia marginata]|nr:hypothetical protein F5X99DRAFT_399004 [Biscogniauxia marginata]
MRVWRVVAFLSAAMVSLAHPFYYTPAHRIDGSTTTSTPDNPQTSCRNETETHIYRGKCFNTCPGSALLSVPILLLLLLLLLTTAHSCKP